MYYIKTDHPYVTHRFELILYLNGAFVEKIYGNTYDTFDALIKSDMYFNMREIYLNIFYLYGDQWINEDHDFYPMTDVPRPSGKKVTLGDIRKQLAIYYINI